MDDTGHASALRHFFASEAAGGLLLIGAAALALIVANGGWGDAYRHLLHLPAGTLPIHGPTDLHFWVNDGLMAVFFLLVGLEIKREWLEGNLRDPASRRLPLIAAAVGMALPAIVYIAVAGSGDLIRGWAIPAATDIAFAIGVLALLGRRAPASLKLFLTSVSIADDLGAVAIIAIAYTARLDWAALAAAAVIAAAMYAMGRAGVRRLWPFAIGAVLLWYAMLVSGVHATVAGVIAAATVPIATDEESSPLHRLEHQLAPWVAFGIVPLFGFANAGVSLTGLGLGSLFAPLPLAIAAGLFLGKQVGIFGAVRAAVALRIAPRPSEASWLQVYGVALLCGIGFTMSLFIGALAFPDRPDLAETAKIGILAGSLLSAVTGFLVLRLAPRPRPSA
ncbi:Na+/H+ antiporter NhaA [Sphingosinicella ginsenosidimutans]|uniref:Na(+)/H(+) antiporter NhaA n=1 Tax=Allosphingosinicella ginsenosidimutans TaxID=1176539 RepID=A0A5C6TSC0_9SPHN|nr:Na+/H+ antiporter NhaA [Sphingosinicella ginsenosidimutans]TXC63090.1 Na+/H+ antiporter NhaA [Sphingosinicella ginsenosidimutans]